jgi:hypothetical protein
LTAAEVIVERVMAAETMWMSLIVETSSRRYPEHSGESTLSDWPEPYVYIVGNIKYQTPIRNEIACKLEEYESNKWYLHYQVLLVVKGDPEEMGFSQRLCGSLLGGCVGASHQPPNQSAIWTFS